MSTLGTRATRGLLFLLGLSLFFVATNWSSSRADDRDSYAAWVGQWEITIDGKEKITLTLAQSRRGLYGKYTPGNGPRL